MGSSVILPAPGQPKEGPDPSFKTPAYSSLVSFKFDHVSPPSQLYIQRDDVLVIAGSTQLLNEVVTITARILQPAGVEPGQPDAPATPAAAGGVVGRGRVQIFQQSFTFLPQLGAVGPFNVQLMEGYLLSVTAVAAAAGVRGQTFVRCWLNQGKSTLNPTTAQFVLFSDYVTFLGAIGWPFGRALSSSDGPGFVAFYNPANPAAGVDIGFFSNSPGRVRFGSFRATFNASAVAGNRVVTINLFAGGGPSLHYSVQDTAAVTAGQVVNFSMGPGVSFTRGGGTPPNVAFGAPSPFFARVQLQITTLTQGILAGDQWSGIAVTTEEWLDSF